MKVGFNFSNTYKYIQKGDLALKNSKFKTILDDITHMKSEFVKRKACQQLEAVFINMMFQQMRKTVVKSGLFDETYAKKVYTSMFDEEIAKEVSRSGGIGLADMIYKQLNND